MSRVSIRHTGVLALALFSLAACSVPGGETPAAAVPVQPVQSTSLPPAGAASPAGAPGQGAQAGLGAVTATSGLPATAPLGSPPPMAGASLYSGSGGSPQPPIAGGAIGVAQPQPGFAAQQVGVLSPQIVAGDWNATDRNGTSNCRVTLTAGTSITGYRASPFGCTSPDMFRVSHWMMRGNEIILAAPGGVTQVILRPSAANRFDGTGVTGERFTLWR